MEGALTRRAAERLIEAATAAPSIHNSQPWRFVARLDERVIEIYADPTRTLRRGDPRGRAVHIACGSALFNLRLAIIQAGCEPVARLLPCPRDPLLLASVRLAGPYRSRPAERDMYAAIRRPAGRWRPTGHALPRGLLSALREAAVLEGASLRLLGQAEALCFLRDLPPGPDSRPPPQPVWGASPQVAVISTSADDRPSWLRAGQAAQRVLLLATHRRLQAAPLSPALEAPGAPAHAEPALDGEHAAMILRLGYGQRWPLTARRPVAQVLRVVPPAGVGQAAGLGRPGGPGDGSPPALASGGRELMTLK